MNTLNNNSDDVVECPLCMEPLEVDDLNFFPCTCGYQICRFCWHRIRTDENELCPACRKAYPENPADFTPLTQEEMIAFKSQKRQRDQQRKQKITENRKHLANVRVVQKNLVFVVGLPPRLADPDILKKHEYFGKFGKIHKVVINPSTAYAGVQGPSASAYVTYVYNTDALRAIHNVNNINIDGRPIKTSLGTTKYCSHFMKNQQCPKSDCMYLHELGDPDASFTKEEMHQGKHQEYEKRLHETLLSNSVPNSNGSVCGNSLIGATGKTVDSKMNTGTNSLAGPSTMSSSSSSSSSSSYSTSVSNTTVTVSNVQQKEAWPSLSESPINNKDSLAVTSGKNKKDKTKFPEKFKNEKCSKTKGKNTSAIVNVNTCVATNKDNMKILKDTTLSTDIALISMYSEETKQDKFKVDKRKSEKFLNGNLREKQCNDHFVDEEIHFLDFNVSSDEKTKSLNSINTNENEHINYESTSNVSKAEGLRSLSSSSDTSSTSSCNANSNNDRGNGKKTVSIIDEEQSLPISTTTIDKPTIACQLSKEDHKKEAPNKIINNDMYCTGHSDNTCDSIVEVNIKNVIDNGFSGTQPRANVFTDHNSLYSSSNTQMSLLVKNKLEAEVRQNINVSQLPDLLSGIDGFQNNAVNGEEWENAIKGNIPNNQQSEDQEQLHHQQKMHREEFLIQEMQKRNSLNNNFGLMQLGGSHDFKNVLSNIFDGSDFNRMSHSTLLQQQQLLQQCQQQSNPSDQNNLFGTNMSKFFDFHKNQQQIQQLIFNGGHNNVSANCNSLNDHIRIPPLQENNRYSSQFLDQTNNTAASKLLKERLNYDNSSLPTTHQDQHSQQQHVQPSRISNQFSQNVSVDDDLGFDPFIETQKALAELMENELTQQSNINTHSANNIPPTAVNLSHQQQHVLDNMHRTRMPPPGFNNMNACGVGVLPIQNNSKMLSFTNGGNSIRGNVPMSNGAWNSNLCIFPPQQTSDPQLQTMNPNHSAANNKGYGNTDWTAMDPAILSFRQFSFPQQPQLSHPSQQDFFMQNITQQPNVQGYGGPHSQIQRSGLNVSNGVMNMQNPSSQVNANVQGMLEYLKNRQYL